MAPLVSICIPVFNREKLVLGAVRSALCQEIPELEVIVIDNCSTDGTWPALHRLSDPRLRLIRNRTNLGLFGNFNRCLEVAQGRYLRILCSDDRLLPGCLVREIATMEDHPNVVVLSSLGYMVDGKRRRLFSISDHFSPGIYDGPTSIMAILWVVSHYGLNPLNFPSGVLVRRNATVRAGPFDETITSTADLDYWLRLLNWGDLAISRVPACEVLLHPGAESNRLFLDGSYMRGQFHIVQKHVALLERENVYRRILEQLSARSLWLALKASLMREFSTARLYLEFPTQYSVFSFAVMRALLRHLTLRVRRRIRGIRVVPIAPIKSFLNVCSELQPPSRHVGRHEAARYDTGRRHFS